MAGLKASMPVNAAGFSGHFYVAMGTRARVPRHLLRRPRFSAAGLAAYYCFQRLPLASLDDALQQLQLQQAELLSRKHQLEMQNLRFDAALNNMSQGLCMFDGERAGRLQRALRRAVRPAGRADGLGRHSAPSSRSASAWYFRRRLPEDYTRERLEHVR